MNYCRFNLNILLLSQIHSCSAGFRTDMDYNENKQTKNGRGLILNAKILLYWQDIKKSLSSSEVNTLFNNFKESDLNSADT